MIAPPFIDPQADHLLSRWAAPRRALFLDRDGVINVNHGYVHRAEDTDWLPGIFQRVRAAHAAGMVPVVVTNQAGIGRGYYDEATFLRFTGWIHAQFAAQDAPLLATFWCPHHPTAALGDYLQRCPCRKPAPGMLDAAIKRFGIDAAGSLMLGDSDSDAAAAAAAGVAFERVG